MITVIDLIHLLTTHAGVNFISLTARTRGDSFRKNGTMGGFPVVPVVNEHYKHIVKTATISLMTGFDYTRRVNKVRAADGLEARDVGPSRAGMIHIDGTPLVRSAAGHLCLWCEVRNVSNVTYADDRTGVVIDPLYLLPFKPVRTGEIAYATYGLENIVAITCNGETHEIDSTTYPAAEQAVLSNLATA